MQRLLIVVPTYQEGVAQLDTVSEVFTAASANNLKPTILHGQVGKREFLSHVASGDYDAIHFATHGDTYAVHLSDEVVYESEIENAFAQAERKGRSIQVVILNGCKSIILALRLHGMGEGAPRYVIGWRDDVTDEVGNAFAAAFWAKVYKDADMHTVFERAEDEMVQRFPEHERPVLVNGMKAIIVSLTEHIEELTSAVRAEGDEKANAAAETEKKRKFERLMFIVLLSTMLGLSVLSVASFIIMLIVIRG